MEKENNLEEKARAEIPEDSTSINTDMEKANKFWKSDITRDDLLFPLDLKITCKEAIESYGQRLGELSKGKLGGEKVTQKELAKICGVSSQTISNIIRGIDKSINIACCNKLAQYFDCSVYYLIGVANERYGVVIDKKEFKTPLVFVSKQETMDVLQAGQWARKDQDLFILLERVFHADIKTRVVIREALKRMLRD